MTDDEIARAIVQSSIAKHGLDTGMMRRMADVHADVAANVAKDDAAIAMHGRIAAAYRHFAENPAARGAPN